MAQIINLPDNGRHVVRVEAGQSLRFTADLASASFGRPEADADGNKSPDLLVTFDNGSELLLEGFFLVAAEGENALPVLELADGTTIAGEQFLAAMNPDLDLSTAAGPSTVQSSGLNDMADLPDLAASGVDRLGSLGTDQFSNARASGGIEYTTLSPLAGTGDDRFAQAPATPPAVTPPPDPVKPTPDPDPVEPTTSFVVRAALLDSDGAKNPTVFMHMDRLLENGSAGSPTVAFTAPPDSKYTVIYDETTGNIVITLKDPSAGPQPVENITVTVTGPDGEARSFVIQAGSSEGTDAAAIPWPPATADESAGLGDLSNGRQIWVGEHERHIEDGATVLTPSVPDSGHAIHYQLTDSHMKAESGESNNVVLNLGGTDKDGKATDGSFLLANSTDGSGRGLVETGHSDPLINKDGAFLSPYDNYDNTRYHGQDYGDKADYRGTVFAGMTAQGEASYKAGDPETYYGTDPNTGKWGAITNETQVLDEFTPAENRVIVKGGSAEIRVEADTPVFDGNDHAVVSGTWAEKGGLNAVTSSGDLSVNVSSGGITGGGEKSATVSGVRSHGAVMSTDVDNGYYRVPEADRNPDHGNTASYGQYRVAHASRTELSSEEGDVNVGVTMTGNAAEQDHSRVSYAAVAATERGQVDIKAAEDVNIAVTNEVEGAVETGGAYGIYAGYGLGADDMARRSDFSKHERGEYGKASYDESDYRAYMNALASDYARDNAYSKYYTHDENGREETHSDKVKEDASRVTIEAEKNLNVDVNLGAQGYKGEAAAVKTLFGDVDIKAGGDVNLGLRSAGNVEGAVSGVHFAGGELNIAAWGNVNIDAKANGSDVAALRIQPQGAAENPDYGHIGEAGLKPPASVNIEGENIRLTAEAGADGTSRDNAATGIDTRGAVGAENLELRFSAEQDISVSATAHARGGETSATGIAHNASIYSSYTKQGGPLDMTFDARKVDVSAKIEGGSGTATGISNTGGRLVIHGEGEIYGDPYQENVFDQSMMSAINNLTITAEGGTKNVGVVVGERNASDDDHDSKEARTDIHAKELEINAKGGAGSESYGAVANSYSKFGKAAELNINTDRLVINAEGEKAVGLSADGNATQINITNATNSYARDSNYWNGQYDELGENPGYRGLQVVINAKVTDQSQLAGIALEALNGGYVRIISDSSRDEYNWGEEGATPVPGDSISLNGDIRVGNTHTGNEGDYDYYNYSVVEIETGHGDDLISIRGDVHVGTGDLYLKTGGGNDTVLIDGNMNIGLNDSGLGGEGNVDMAFAKGNNVLHITGDVNLGGNSALSIFSDAYDESQAMNMVVDGTVNLGDRAQVYIDTGIGNDTVVLSGGVNFATDGNHYQGSDPGGDEMSVSTFEGHDQVEVGGVRFRDADNPHSPYSKGRFSIDTGDGNDMLIMNGKVEYGSTIEGDKYYETFTATMGDGHDMLVLMAESYEQFMEYYGEWLDADKAGGLEELACNGIIVTGATGEDGQRFIDWLQEQAEASGLNIEVQNYGDANMSFVNDAVNLSGDFAFDGSQGNNDGLYVRFNDGHGNEGDQGDKALANLTQAFESGRIQGLEFLVLDMANGEEQDLNIDQFSSFLDMVRNQGDTTRVILRADEGDNLNLADNGWTQGANENIGGVEYSVYYGDSEADKLYVQVVTDSIG